MGELPAEAGRAVMVVRTLLEHKLIGAYLFGSAVVGGLHPHSDVDILVVTRGPLTLDERKDLLAGLMRVSAPGARPIELTIVTLADVVPWRYPPQAEFVFGEWLRAGFERGELPMPHYEPDLALVLSNVRADSLPVVGVPAERVLDPVPADDLRRAMADSLPQLLATLHGDERNVLLILARMWTTAVSGELVTKDAAARWVIDELPAGYQPVLDAARRAYVGEAECDWNARQDEVSVLAAYMRRAVEFRLGRRHD